MGCTILRDIDEVQIKHLERQIQAIGEGEDARLVLDQVYLAAIQLAAFLGGEMVE